MYEKLNSGVEVEFKLNHENVTGLWIENVVHSYRDLDGTLFTETGALIYHAEKLYVTGFEKIRILPAIESLRAAS